MVDTTGDNLMAEFSSVVDAVKCAVETQKELSERNAALPEKRRMLFRIGVNLGDIVEEEDRIYGEGSISLPEWKAWPMLEASVYLELPMIR